MRFVMWVLASALVATPVGPPRLAKKDLDEAKRMVKGVLYLRLDLPCKYIKKSSWGGYGSAYVEAVLEVSPDSSNLEGQIGDPASRFLMEGVYWGFRPNDPVNHSELYYSGDVLELDTEGGGDYPKDDEALFRFVGINTLDDFKKAFNRVFSRVPLQDEHPEWPSEMRKAIAERRLVEGMTRQQAYCVVGTPMKIENSEENGAKVETWFPRQQDGTHLPRKLVNPPTGFPTLLKFVDDRLTIIEKPPPAR